MNPQTAILWLFALFGIVLMWAVPDRFPGYDEVLRDYKACVARNDNQPCTLIYEWKPK